MDETEYMRVFNTFDEVLAHLDSAGAQQRAPSVEDSAGSSEAQYNCRTLFAKPPYTTASLHL